MLLRCNISNIRHERRLLDVDISNSSVFNDNELIHLVLKTFSPHKLKIGDIVLLDKNIPTTTTYNETFSLLKKGNNKVVELLNNVSYLKENELYVKTEVYYEKGFYIFNSDEDDIEKINSNDIDRVLNQYSSVNENFRVDDYKFDETTFSVAFKKNKTIYVDEITYGDTLSIAHIIGEMPFKIKKDEEFLLFKKEQRYERKKSADENDKKMYKEVVDVPTSYASNIGYDFLIFGNGLYQWVTNTSEILCKAVSDNFFTFQKEYSITENDILEVCDNRFVTEDGFIKSDVSFYEYNEYNNFNIPIISDNLNNLNDSDICKKYFEEKKNSFITDIIDYEKICFTPYSFNISNNTYSIVNSIKFNIFLRDRSNSEDWSTNDLMGWNQFKTDSNGKFPSKPQSTLTNGDLLGDLNFTDEDVYYRKKKLSKSFIRLSFYNSNNPFNNMLLFYSTIFIDSGKLYSKYMKNIKLKNNGVTLVDYNGNNDDNLTLSFTTNDRYNKNASSEGFYLYLFPDGLEPFIEDGEVKYPSKTIYMKVEFNHAKYGKTVPLFYPTKNGKIIDMMDSEFPKSLMTENGDLSELYRQLYIPLKITYNKKISDFIYYFDTVKMENNELQFNLYEPKINAID